MTAPAAPANPRFREFMLWAHRWMGLGASIVLGLVGVSGVLLVWAPEEEGTALVRFHTRLMIGEPGEWLVITATVLSSLLILGGVYLWWKRKIVAVALSKGWFRAVFDFHHSLGLFATAIMLVISLSGVGLVLTEAEQEEGQPPPVMTPEQEATHREVEDFHTGRDYPLPVKLLYAAGSAGFLIQSLTGFLMWWKPQVKNRD